MRVILLGNAQTSPQLTFSTLFTRSTVAPGGQCTLDISFTYWSTFRLIFYLQNKLWETTQQWSYISNYQWTEIESTVPLLLSLVKQFDWNTQTDTISTKQKSRVYTSGFNSRFITRMSPCALETLKRKKGKTMLSYCRNKSNAVCNL